MMRPARGQDGSLSGTQVLAALSRHIGADNGVGARELVREIEGLFVLKSDERLLRRAIEELRREGHHICGTPAEGYYVAGDEVELNRTCRFLYERAMTTLAQVAAMKRVALPDLRGQLKLPT
ncbi:MAG: hypothetical protein KGL35_08860 [Bradyrhizobium sp.]|nr:hypothetical protein [Bradyrhizobium sp.]